MQGWGQVEIQEIAGYFV